VVASTTKITRITLCGLPQGGALSLLLWSLVAIVVNQTGSFCPGYADDGVVLVCGKVLSTMSEIMQHILWGVEEWCKKRDLRVRPIKMVMILSTRKYKAESVRPLTFYFQQLTLSNQVKYLGSLS